MGEEQKRKQVNVQRRTMDWKGRIQERIATLNQMDREPGSKRVRGFKGRSSFPAFPARLANQPTQQTQVTQATQVTQTNSTNGTTRTNQINPTKSS